MYALVLALVLAAPDAPAPESHWAFRPIRDPAPPAVSTAEWPRTSVDRFVLAALEARELRPAPEADRRTLIRRATLDLIGLPPTPGEIEAFVAEREAGALERLVDRLLASPGHGERWGRHWLDVARYADNKGYVFFEEKTYPWAYTYRDWVIRAFNEDLPFDRFVLEQLAADRLDLGADRRALAAMGFLTLGGRFMNNLHDVLDDRIDVVTRGLLGLTVTCARCHDHKHDPIRQSDYYSLYGILRSSVEPTLRPTFLPPPATGEYREFAAGIKARVQKLTDFVETTRAAIGADARKRVAEYLLAVHTKRGQPSTEDFMLLTEKGALNPAVIQRWENYLRAMRRDGHPAWIVWQRFGDLEDDEFVSMAPTIHAEILSAGDSGSTVNPLVRSTFGRGPPPQSMKDVADRYGALLNVIEERWQLTLAEARKRSGPGAELAVPGGLDDPAAEELRQVLHGVDSPASIPPVTGSVFLALLPDRPIQEEFKKLLKELETWSMTAPGAPPRAMVLVNAAVPYDPAIFIRGNPGRPGEPVKRRFLDVLSRDDGKAFNGGSGRLELARVIVDTRNPLTARVIVNRIWHHHFGAGLVRTPSDFGLHGERPTHPELLDHLATELVRRRWSIKDIHRLIMTSAVYRQASESRADARLVDPDNRLLWKFNRRRLELEAVRDSLLAVSGSLDRSMGGKSVNLLDGFVTRRTIYGFIDRMDLPGLFRTFDYPDPAASSPRRDSTMVASRALYLMNSDFVTECARRVLGRPDVAAAADHRHRIERVYRILLGRTPTSREVSLATKFLTEAATTERWLSYVQALLMSNEFVFVD